MSYRYDDDYGPELADDGGLYCSDCGRSLPTGTCESCDPEADDG